jgi:hypothetical protein
MPTPSLSGLTPASLGDLQNYLGNIEREMRELRNKNEELENQIEELGRLTVTDQVTEDWLQVPFRFVGFASGATSVVTRTVAGDGPFDLVEITYTSVDSQGQQNADWRIRIKEGEAVGRALTQDSEFVDLSNTAGTGMFPYIIKGRRRFRANIAIQVEVTNTHPGPMTNTLELVLHGIKVFVR